jgi:hypothetical protein
VEFFLWLHAGDTPLSEQRIGEEVRRGGRSGDVGGKVVR